MGTSFFLFNGENCHDGERGFPFSAGNRREDLRKEIMIRNVLVYNIEYVRSSGFTLELLVFVFFFLLQTFLTTTERNKSKYGKY